MRSRKIGFWKWGVASIAVRLILSCYYLNLSSRPEVSTPTTSLRRLAEGYWLKQEVSMSPYSGSMYHGSPLLLSILGPPLTIGGHHLNHLLCRFYHCNSSPCNWTDPSNGPCSLSQFVGPPTTLSRFILLSKHKQIQNLLLLLLCSALLSTQYSPDILPSGDIAALVYLWNPFTIVSCIAFNTSPIENMFVILSLYAASAGLVPLAAFGWVVASHLSLYPLVLVIPVTFLLGYGLDAPPRKLFRNLQVDNKKSAEHDHHSLATKPAETRFFSWKRVILFCLWASLWMSYILILCAISVKQYGGLGEMFKRTYGFILTVKDLSPNIGVLWYFFAEVFDYFRSFFLIVFHVNILFMVLPLAIRLNHRPCFLAFVYLAISSMLKSYPSVGDSALYLSLFTLFINELAEMQLSFFLFCGYIGVSLLSPVMHNLWIWRGTGNANFYFATAMAYACFQIILVVESVSAMLNYDRKIKRLCKASKV